MVLVVDILRHGEALPMDEGGDRRRPLSPQGVLRLEELARQLAGTGWNPDHIFSSPLTRARESARIVGRLAEPASHDIAILEALEPDAEPSDLIEALAARGIISGHIVLVGHQPLLGRLVGYLTGAEVSLSPGTLVRVDCPNGAGRTSGTVTMTISPRAAGRS